MKVIARILLLLATVGIVAAGCGDAASGAVRTVKLVTTGFDPASLTAQPGDAIVFQNQLLAKARFMSNSPSGLFDSGETQLVSKGGAFEWKIPATQPEGLVRYEENLTGLYSGSISVVLKAPGK